jgi:NAD(P)-dependent dehydrogenase (short-subunit alcohol dehydrogenase family)
MRQRSLSTSESSLRPHKSKQKKGLKHMTDKKVWFITGAGRGMGVDIAQAALAAGHAVVATGRNTEAVADAVGEADDLLVVELDITSLASAEAALQAAVDRFGRVDVLVNNAGNFYAGYFEELTPEQIERSLTTNLVGPMNVTRVVLPVMRKQRSGNVVTITSTAGIVGQEFCSAYAASKFGLEGWMESLRFEVEPLGIHTTIVEPGSFAPSCSKRSQRPTPSCRSTTTPSAPPRPGPPGRR